MKSSLTHKPFDIGLVIFLVVFAVATGFLLGDTTADRRFVEERNSIRSEIKQSIVAIDKTRAVLKANCFLPWTHEPYQPVVKAAVD